MRHLSPFAVALSLSLILAITSMATSPVAADTFECERVWKKPSADNTIIGCLLNATHLATLFNTNSERAEIGAVLIPLAIVVLVVIIFPIFLSLRYCVDFCGSYHRRPGYFCYGGEEWDGVDEATKDRFYDPADASCTRALAYICLFLGFCPMMLLFVGTGDIQDAYNTLFAEVFGVVGWAETKEREMRRLVTVNGTFIGSINQTFLDNLAATVAGYKADLVAVNDVNIQVIDMVKIISIVFAIVPMFSLLANAIFAAFDIRKTWPLINSFFHFIFLCLYAVIGSGVLLLGVLTVRICGERDAYLAGSPSIASYYLVPRCNQSLSFAPVEQALADARTNTSYGACIKLQYHCNQASNTYNGGTPEKIFYCPTLTNPQTQCTKSSEVDAIFTNTQYVTLSSGGPTCTTTPCNISNCMDTCSTQTAKDIAADVYGRWQDAVRVQTATNIFETEVGNCNALTTRALTDLKSCSQIKSSVFFVGVGSCIFTGLFLIGLVVIFRGQKRFFKPIHKVPKATGGISPGSRSPTTRSPQTKSIEPIG